MSSLRYNAPQTKLKGKQLGENICIVFHTTNDIKYKELLQIKIKQPQRKSWTGMQLALVERVLLARHYPKHFTCTKNELICIITLLINYD